MHGWVCARISFRRRLIRGMTHALLEFACDHLLDGLLTEAVLIMLRAAW